MIVSQARLVFSFSGGKHNIFSELFCVTMMGLFNMATKAMAVTLCTFDRIARAVLFNCSFFFQIAVLEVANFTQPRQKKLTLSEITDPKNSS